MPLIWFERAEWGFWVFLGGVGPLPRCASLSFCLSFFLSVSAAVVALHSTQLSHQSWRAGIFLTAEAPGNSLYQGGIHPVKRTARRNSADFLFTQFDAGFEISDLEMLY